MKREEHEEGNPGSVVASLQTKSVLGEASWYAVTQFSFLEEGSGTTYPVKG